MKQKKIKLSVLLLAFGLTGLHAQESINATGGNASGSGGSSSYTIGQVAYTTNIGTNGSVSQGVQQPYEISVVTSIPEAKGINISVSAYPNPTTENLTLKVEDFELSTLNFQLFDTNGKFIDSKKIDSDNTSIKMNHLAPASYFLKVTEGKKEIKTFKIIKK